MWNIISAERNHYRTFGRDDRSRLNNRAFSHDVTAAMLVFQNNETAAILVSFLMQALSFVPINLHGCCPRE